MKVHGKHYRSLWWNADDAVLEIIDQRPLPYKFVTEKVRSLEDFANAIREMRVRGAPLIGATAAYGLARAMSDDPSDSSLETASEYLRETRPTAVNLSWALERVSDLLLPLPEQERASEALSLAHAIAEEDVEINRRIGAYGVEIIREISESKPRGEPVRVLTHCNAGWLATVDWGTATSPIYQAYDAGLPLHVWVDETRPRNQGALTAWELGCHGVPHSYITDNSGGHLMQHGMVDVVITGTDRTTRSGDVCNKIGTYLKALAAKDNNVPFYVALPSPTIDWDARDGVAEIPIEQRDKREVTHVQGISDDGTIGMVKVTPEGTEADNPAFDVTPSRLVTGLITEKGVCEASEAGLSSLFPEHALAAE